MINKICSKHTLNKLGGILSFKMRKIKCGFVAKNDSLRRNDILILLDSAFAQHVTLNKSFISYNQAAFSKEFIILNAPGITALQNSISAGVNRQKLYDFDRIIEVSKKSEKEGFGNYYGINGTKIFSLVSDLPHAVLVDIFNEIKRLKSVELTKYNYDGIDLGKAVSIDLSLNLKSSNRDCNDELQNDFYRLTVFYIRLILYFVKNYSANTDNVFQNSSYSVNYAIRKFVELDDTGLRLRNFVPLYMGNKLLRFKIAENTSVDNYLRRRLSSGFCSDSLISEAFEYVEKHLQDQVFGNSPFRYSPDPEELREADVHSLLKLDKSKKILVYFTSSPDEDIASDVILENTFMKALPKRQPFSDEIAAIKFVASVAKKSNAYLIVRFHPRLGIESRVPFESDQYNDFLNSVRKLKTDFENLIVIDAYQNISSYWLAGWAYRAYSLRSSMGNVLPLMCVPFTILADNKGFNVAEFDRIVINSQDLDSRELPSDDIDLSVLTRLILGYYITNFHAGFSCESYISEESLDDYKKSIRIGYSCIAFLPNASEDLRSSVDINFAHTYISDHLDFLSNKFSCLSAREDYSILHRVSNLRNKTSSSL